MATSVGAKKKQKETSRNQTHPTPWASALLWRSVGEFTWPLDTRTKPWAVEDEEEDNLEETEVKCKENTKKCINAMTKNIGGPAEKPAEKAKTQSNRRAARLSNDHESHQKWERNARAKAHDRNAVANAGPYGGAAAAPAWRARA